MLTIKKDIFKRDCNLKKHYITKENTEIAVLGKNQLIHNKIMSFTHNVNFLKTIFKRDYNLN